MQSSEYGYPTFQQYELCKLRDRHRRVLIAGCRGGGKSFFKAREIWRHLITQYVPGKPCKVLITSPSGGQVDRVLMPEIVATYHTLLPFFQDQFTLLTDRIYCRHNRDNWFVEPSTPKKERSESAQGIHGNALNILDEAFGIDDQIINIIISGMTETSQSLLGSGNPTKLSGIGYDVFQKELKTWGRYFIDAYECLEDDERSYPYFDVFGKKNIIRRRGLVSRDFLNSMIDLYGEGTPLFTSFVRGQFPVSEMNQLIKKDWLDRAFRTEQKDNSKNFRVMGVDPGFEVDPAGIVVRQGLNIEDAEAFKGVDTPILSAHVAERFNQLKNAGREVKMICIDAIGNGKGVYDTLKADFPIMQVNSWDACPPHGVKCKRLRDWLWWQARSFYRDHRPHFCDMTDAMKDLAYELRQPGYSYQGGAVKVEGKDELRKRGIKSPNLADAHNLTFKYDWKIPETLPMKRRIDRYRRKLMRQEPTSWKVI